MYIGMAEKSDAEVEFALVLRSANVSGWEREYRFAHPRKWRFDFAWRAEKFALEIEGGVWIQGRHNRARGYVADLEKYNSAALLGWRILRVTPEMVSDGTALRLVAEMLGLGSPHRGAISRNRAILLGGC